MDNYSVITLHECSKLHANIFIKIWNNKSSKYANVLKNKLTNTFLLQYNFIKGKNLYHVHDKINFKTH